MLPMLAALDSDLPSSAAFLEKPTLLATLTGVDFPATPVSASYLDAYFALTAVQRKLWNMNVMRYTFHLRFTITSPKFMKGKLAANVQYRTNASNCTEPTYEHTFLTRDHITLDLGRDNAAELIIPYFSKYPFHPINDLPSDLPKIGLMQLDVPMNVMDGLTTGGTVVYNVDVHAWLSDLQLAVPTYMAEPTSASSLKPKRKARLARSSGDNPDKAMAHSGVVSGPASIIANGARSLADVPFIGAFARSVDKLASATSEVAADWGFSRPATLNAFTVIDKPSYSNGIGAERIKRLAADPQQQLSIDPRKVSSGTVDPLSIATFTRRWSLWKYFSWTTADTVGSNLQVYPVSPGNVQGGVDTYHHTTLSYASSHFTFWRGGIEYKIQVIGNEYTKGRLLVTWIPDFTNASGATLSTATGTSYSTTVDASNYPGTCITVSWGSPRPYQQVILDTSSAVDLDNLNATNGALVISVAEALRMPMTGTLACRVLVWVRGAEDFELALPTTRITENMHRTDYGTVAASWAPTSAAITLPTVGYLTGGLDAAFVESDEVFTDQVVAEDTASLDLVEQAKCVEFGPVTIVDGPARYYMGEKIMSFRTLMHKYHPTYHYYSGTSGVEVLNVGISPMESLRYDIGGTKHTPSRNNVLNTIVWCFAGWSGSWRVRLDEDTAALSSTNVDRKRTIYITTSSAINRDSIFTFGGGANTDSTAANWAEALAGRGFGYEAINYNHGENIAVEVPYITNEAFYTTNVTYQLPNTPGPVAQFVIPLYAVSTQFTVAHAIGEDFQVHRWDGLPAVKHYVQPRFA